MAEHKTIPSISLETQQLIKRLINTEVEEVVSYWELSKIINRNVQQEARGNLTTARIRLLTDEHMVFGTVRKVGVKLLGPKETVDAGYAHIPKNRKSSHRGSLKLKSMSAQDFVNLSPDDKHRQQISLTVLTMTEKISSKKQIAKLGIAVSEQNKMLSLRKAIQALL